MPHTGTIDWYRIVKATCRIPLTDACSMVCDAKEDILSKDWICTLHESRSQPSLVVVWATDGITSSWTSAWDEALEYGVRGTRFMQGLYGSLAKQMFQGDKACPHWNTTTSDSYSEHQILFTKHIPLTLMTLIRISSGHYCEVAGKQRLQRKFDSGSHYHKVQIYNINVPVSKPTWKHRRCVFNNCGYLAKPSA
jgi:hypothetical protein